MILTDLFESQEIHNQDRLDSVLGRCIELIHEKHHANPNKYGKVAACIIDVKNRKVFGINSPGPNGTRRHAERMAIDKYHERYGKILPGAIIVTTLSPCNRDMAERDGPSCQDLLIKAGIEKVYSGYMDPSQHSDHPFTEEMTKNDDLWRRCKEFSDSFVHDDLSESQHNTMAADQVLDYVKRTHAPDEFNIEYSITDHPKWELTNIPLSQLNLDPDGKTQDPYNRVNWVDDDKVQELIPRITSVLKSKPIVIDPAGWIIDGNHRAVAAVEAGLTSVPALVPVKPDVAEDAENFNGVKISMEKEDDEIMVTAMMPGGRKLGHVLFVQEGDYLMPQDLEVDERYQGQGIAATMYDYVKSKGYKIRRSGQQTDAGAGFWDKHRPEQNVWENFADGRNPQDKGDSKRHGVPTKASVTTLRKVAKQGGRKGQLAHWMANMKAGRAKARKK
jgi:pyrimidine deaminase RibD-like protein